MSHYLFGFIAYSQDCPSLCPWPYPERSHYAYWRWWDFWVRHILWDLVLWVSKEGQNLPLPGISKQSWFLHKRTSPSFAALSNTAQNTFHDKTQVGRGWRTVLAQGLQVTTTEWALIQCKWRAQTRSLCVLALTQRLRCELVRSKCELLRARNRAPSAPTAPCVRERARQLGSRMWHPGVLDPRCWRCHPWSHPRPPLWQNYSSPPQTAAWHRRNAALPCGELENGLA